MPRLRHQATDLIVREDVRPSPPPAPWESPVRRHLGLGILRLEPRREAPHHREATCPGRALDALRRHGPSQRQSGRDVRRAFALEEGDELGQRRRRLHECRAECTSDLDVVRQHLAQGAHRTPPVSGQGRATVRSASNDTLA